MTAPAARKRAKESIVSEPKGVVSVDSDIQWVLGLKVGDKVAIRRRWESGYDIHPVAAITPSGRVRLKMGDSAFWEFGTNGWLRGADQWNQTRIEPVTQQVRDANRKAILRARISKTDWSRVDIAVLEQIVALLPEPKP